MMSNERRCIVLCVVFLVCVYNYMNFQPTIGESEVGTPSAGFPFFIVVCNGEKKKAQLQYVEILLKSAAALTRTNLKFIIFSDSMTSNKIIESQIMLWPHEYQRRLEVSFKLVRYPVGSEGFQRLFQPCSSYRLLFPDVLHNIDAGIYLDTETLFLNPPEELWKEFPKFNDEQLFGAMISSRTKENFENRMKLKAEYAINSGVVLMNLTRMRSTPGGGFSNISMNLFKKYKEIYHDQDIFNTILSKHPGFLYKVGCEWNYYNSSANCTGPLPCPEAEMNGASLVHGQAAHFLKDTPFKCLFEAWKQYKIGSPISDLIENIVQKQKEFEARTRKSLCRNDFASVFSKRLILGLDFKNL